jgi:hypothetical protein
MDDPGNKNHIIFQSNIQNIQKMKLQKVLGLLLCLIAPATFGQGNATGNCISGPLKFDPYRSLALAVSVENPDLDVSTYDFSVDYGYNNSAMNMDALELSLTRNPSGGVARGVRVSTSRHIFYGRISVRITAPAIPGSVVSFITMSYRGDEID